MNSREDMTVTRVRESRMISDIKVIIFTPMEKRILTLPIFSWDAPFLSFSADSFFRFSSGIRSSSVSMISGAV